MARVNIHILKTSLSDSDIPSTSETHWRNTALNGGYLKNVITSENYFNWVIINVESLLHQLHLVPGNLKY